jgi:hypothetical protein
MVAAHIQAMTSIVHVLSYPTRPTRATGPTRAVAATWPATRDCPETTSSPIFGSTCAGASRKSRPARRAAPTHRALRALEAGGPPVQTIHRNTRGGRMDRHAATLRRRHLTDTGGVKITRMHPTSCGTPSSPSRSTPASTSATSRSPPATPTPAPPCATTEPARTSTATPTATSPPSWPPERKRHTVH